MRITWRDGITTAAAAAAVIVERAYFHNWNWPLVHEVGWAIAAVILAGYACFYYSFAYDDDPSAAWSVIAYSSTGIAAVLAALGVLTNNSGFLVALTVMVVFLWAVSIIQHFKIPKSSGQHMAHQ